MIAKIAALSASCLFAASFCQAEEFDIPDIGQEASQPDNAERTRITLGGALRNTPLYYGATERIWLLYPTFTATWASGGFIGVNSVGGDFSQARGIRYGLRVSSDPGRKEADSPALQGLGNVDSRTEIGGFIRLGLGKGLRLSTDLKYGSGQNSNGLVADIGIHQLIPISDKHAIVLGVMTSWANRNHMQTYFGVDASQSAASGYAAYTPGAGIRDSSLSINYIYSLNRHWSASAGAAAGRLGRTASDAPMTRTRSYNTTQIGARYVF